MQDRGGFPCPYCHGVSCFRVPISSLLSSFARDPGSLDSLELVGLPFAEYERTAVQWKFRDCSGAGWCWVRKG